MKREGFKKGVPSRYSIRLAVLAVRGSREVSGRALRTESGYEEGCVWGARFIPSELGVLHWLTLTFEAGTVGEPLFPAQP